MDTYLDDLNPQQKEAVCHTEGPLLILAGAGSGKTRVLTYRIAHLVGECGVKPWNILAITFTNKAATEMKERLEALCGSDTQDMWVRTFHSACVRILRREIASLEYDTNFNIYDATDQKSVVKDCLRELNLDEKKYVPKAVLAAISDAKDKLLSPQDYMEEYKTDYFKFHLAKIYELYQKKLKINNALDFDDLITVTVRLFEENPQILEKYQNKFRYILVDEYQDTNNAQYKLISLLGAKYKNVCVVGDDDQSIYKFRGADIRNILEFEKDFKDATVIKLEQNYRSTQNILDSANAVIKQNKGRTGKKLWTENGEGDKITVYCGYDEKEEARYIADEIKHLNTFQEVKLSDIAILYRNNAQSRVLEETFMRSAIPHRILSGLRFYDRKEIKDMIAYLRLVNNPHDDISFKRVVNEPRRGIGKTSVNTVAVLASQRGVSMFDEVNGFGSEIGRAAGKLKEFTDMISEIRTLIDSATVKEIVETVLERSGYMMALLSTPEDEEAKARIENLKEFVSSAKNYDDEAQEPSFNDFLDNISLISDIDNYDEDLDCVVLMTMHAAKGLEFPYVFLCGAENGIFPSQRSMDTEEDIEEERRLCYVAITRARKKLYITHAQQRYTYGATTYNSRSMFVDEIPENILQVISETKSYGHIAPKQEKVNHIASVFERPKNPALEANVFTDYHIGERVSHKKFGEGTILVVQPVGNDVRLEIAFDKFGTKNLMAVYAKLTRLDG